MQKPNLCIRRYLCLRSEMRRGVEWLRSPRAGGSLYYVWLNSFLKKRVQIMKLQEHLVKALIGLEIPCGRWIRTNGIAHLKLKEPHELPWQ
jgi:hypothetical protein